MFKLLIISTTHGGKLNQHVEPFASREEADAAHDAIVKDCPMLVMTAEVCILAVRLYKDQP